MIPGGQCALPPRPPAARSPAPPLPHASRAALARPRARRARRDHAVPQRRARLPARGGPHGRAGRHARAGGDGGGARREGEGGVRAAHLEGRAVGDGRQQAGGRAPAAGLGCCR